MKEIYLSTNPGRLMIAILPHLKRGAEQRLQIVELRPVRLRLDSRLHLQDGLQPLQDDHHSFLHRHVAVLQQ